MLSRRSILYGSIALILPGCGGPDGPGSILISASAEPGMNPGSNGEERPIILTVVQLKSAGAFEAADFYALQDPAAVLGGDLLVTEQVPLAPEATAEKLMSLEPDATMLGVIAGFRDPAGKIFRITQPTQPGEEELPVEIKVGPTGVSFGSG